MSIFKLTMDQVDKGDVKWDILSDEPAELYNLFQLIALV